MIIDDIEFEKRLTAALYRAAELDYDIMPSDDDLEQIVSTSPRFRRKMKSLLSNSHRYINRQRRPNYLRVLRSVAAVFILLVVILSTIMAVLPPARAAVKDFVRSWFSDRTEYETTPDITDIELSFAYIPDGFKLVTEHSALNKFYFYENDDLMSISITISSEKHVVDNEHAKYYNTIINNREVDIYESTNPQYPTTILVYEEMSDTIIVIVSEIDITELIKIAENIK